MSRSLIIPFTDASQSFCNGVEFGRLWAQMERGDDPVHSGGFPVKKSNVDVIRSACAHYGYIPAFGPEYHEWITFVGVKKTTSDN